MKRLIIFKTADPQAEGWEHRTFPGGALSDILAQHYDYSDRPLLEPGYRLPEFKHDDSTATFDHRGGITHRRESPWKVVRVEEFVGNTGLESLEEVAIAYCEYAPLSESENPWTETEPAHISPNSFGGDMEAFEQWRSKQQVIADVRH